MVRRFLLISLFPLGIAAQPTIDSLLAAVNRQFNAATAYDHVKFFSQFWRIAGGKDFNMCIDYIADALAAGYTVASPGEEVFQFAIASLNKAAERRLGKEADNSKAALNSVGRSQHQYFLQRQKEKEILGAWMEWYDAAYLSLKKLPLILIPSYEESIEQGRSALRSLHKGISERIGID